MSYPRNAASPERIAVGAVVQISDGAVQSSGVSISVRGQGGASGAGGGTTAYDNGIVEYTPIQAETDFTSFIIVAYKTGCIPVSVTIVTSASATAGYSGVDWGFVANKTTTNALTNTTIATTQKVDVETIKTNPVVNAGTITFPTTATLASTTNITAGTITTATNVTTVNGLAANVITAASIPDSTWHELIELMFTYNATGDYAGADAGSLVKQIADNAGGTSLTEAGIAAEVWGTAVPGAFGAGTAGSRLGRVPDVAAGAAGGLFIAGSNAATTFATLTVTGALTISDGIIVTVSTTNRSAISATGNGSGHGMTLVPGATGSGLNVLGGATSGDAVVFTAVAGNSRGLFSQGQGSGASVTFTGGSTGVGFSLNGGGTSGPGVRVSANSGDAMQVTTTGGNGDAIQLTGHGTGAALRLIAGLTGNAIIGAGGATSGDAVVFTTTSGHGISVTATGTNMHGIVSTGGTGGVSDGIKAVAGTGGVDIRGNITGNITGTVDTVTTLTNLPAITANWLTATGLATSAVDEIVDQVWDELIAGHAGVGSTGAALAAAGGSGDPWATALPGAYGAGTAGFIVGTNVNATISSRSSHSAADVWSVGTRSLTVLDEDGTTIDLDATIRAAVGLASANLDTQLDALPTAAESATAVWASGTRTLTSLDEDTVTIDLDGVIRSALGMSTANLDTQLDNLPTNAELTAALAAADDAVLAAIAALPSFDPTTEEVETGFTWTESARLWNAAMGGKASGLGTTQANYRDLGDTKDRIDATVDVDGNRLAVTLDLA